MGVGVAEEYLRPNVVSVTADDKIGPHTGIFVFPLQELKVSKTELCLEVVRVELNRFQEGLIGITELTADKVPDGQFILGIGKIGRSSYRVAELDDRFTVLAFGKVVFPVCDVLFGIPRTPGGR